MKRSLEWMTNCLLLTHHSPHPRHPLPAPLTTKKCSTCHGALLQPVSRPLLQPVSRAFLLRKESDAPCSLRPYVLTAMRAPVGSR